MSESMPCGTERKAGPSHVLLPQPAAALPAGAGIQLWAASNGCIWKRSPDCPATGESFSSISCWMVKSSSTSPRSSAACGKNSEQ